jgi:hypothetical protein
MKLENNDIHILKVTKINEEMTISDLLRNNELYSKDVKQKINNKQLFLNGVPLTLEQLNNKIYSLDEAGDFIFKNIEIIKSVSFFLNIDEMFEAEIPFVRDLFKDLFLLKIAKKKWFVIKITGMIM